jgi:hypothetical protein
MGWPPTQHPTTLKVSTPCWQLLLAQPRRLLLEPPADEPKTKRWPSGVTALCERVKAGFALVAVGLAAYTLLVGNGVGAGESGRRGRWVSVSNPAS